MSRLFGVATLLIAAATTQDDPTTAGAIDLPTLCTRMREQHAPGGKLPDVKAFRGHLILQQESEQGRAAAELQVRYLRWQREDGRVRPLIAYQIVDAARPIERGRDRNGPWCVLNGQLVDLERKENATDRDQLQRHLGLAGQLVRFLDPAAVLGDLAEPTPVTATRLAIGRESPIPCWTVTGTLDAFPLLGQAGDEAPVRLQAFADQTDCRLLAVEVTPLDADRKPIAGRTELLRLGDHRPQGGRLVPMELKHYLVDATGKRQLQMSVHLVALQLDPELGERDFARPK